MNYRGFLLWLSFLLTGASAPAQQVDARIVSLLQFADRQSEFQLKASLDSLNLALDIARKKKDVTAEIQVLRRLSSLMLTKLSNFDEAYRYVDEIKQVAQRHAELPEVMATYHNTLGSIYFYEQANRKKAFAEFRKSLDIFEQHGLKDDPVLLNNYALALMENGEIEQALAVFHRGRSSFRSGYFPYYQDTYLVKNATNLGVCHIFSNKLDSAEFYLRKARELALATFEKSDDVVSTIYLAVFLQEQKQFDEALNFFQLAQSYKAPFVPYSMIVLLYQSMAELYADLGKYELAYENELLSRQYQDSLREKGLEEKAISMEHRATIDAMRHQQSMDELERQFEREKFTRRIIVVISLLVVVIISTLFWLYKLNKQKQLAAIQAENESLEKERIRQQAELELLRKDEQLITANVEISVRENELTTLKSRLEDHLNKNHDPQFHELRQFLNQVQHSKKKTEQLRNLDNVLSLTNNVFYSRFKELHPNLTEDEMRLITLIRLNLSTEELLLVFNITKSSLNTKRYRVRKKIGLSSEQSLEEYVMGV
jgi:tetratricopeptide (TPR) repeat protein